VWERFATAIKIDRIPLFDVSRHCHGDGMIGRFTPRRDFFYRSDWTLAASGPPEAEHLKPIIVKRRQPS
jgi:hypothetical protein